MPDSDHLTEDLRCLQVTASASSDAGVRAASMTEDEIHARDWWCPHCRADVPPEMVTKDGEHYLESGGCGYAVRGELKDAPGMPETPSS